MVEDKDIRTFKAIFPDTLEVVEFEIEVPKNIKIRKSSRHPYLARERVFAGLEKVFSIILFPVVFIFKSPFLWVGRRMEKFGIDRIFGIFFLTLFAIAIVGFPTFAIWKWLIPGIISWIQGLKVGWQVFIFLSFIPIGAWLFYAVIVSLVGVVKKWSRKAILTKVMVIDGETSFRLLSTIIMVAAGVGMYADSRSLSFFQGIGAFFLLCRGIFSLIIAFVIFGIIVNLFLWASLKLKNKIKREQSKSIFGGYLGW